MFVLGKTLGSEITRTIPSPLGASFLPQVTTYRPHKPPLMAFILLLLVRAAKTNKKTPAPFVANDLRNVKRTLAPYCLTAAKRINGWYAALGRHRPRYAGSIAKAKPNPKPSCRRNEAENYLTMRRPFVRAPVGHQRFLFPVKRLMALEAILSPAVMN